jgi:pyrrolidone-carboxylate peptidase
MLALPHRLAVLQRRHAPLQRTLYLTHYLVEKKGLKTQTAFIHLPLATSQAASEMQEIASLTSGRALELIVESLLTQEWRHDEELA